MPGSNPRSVHPRRPARTKRDNRRVVSLASHSPILDVRVLGASHFTTHHTGERFHPLHALLAPVNAPKFRRLTRLTFDPCAGDWLTEFHSAFLSWDSAK